MPPVCRPDVGRVKRRSVNQQEGKEQQEHDTEPEEPDHVVQAVATEAAELVAPDRYAPVGHMGLTRVPADKAGERTGDDR